MANTRARLLGPPPYETDAETHTHVYQVAGRRSGVGAESVLEHLQNDPSRKATEPPVEGHPEVEPYAAGKNDNHDNYNYNNENKNA